MNMSNVQLDEQIQTRVKELVTQCLHYKKKGAVMLFNRRKGELKTLASKYGEHIMFPTYKRYGYDPEKTDNQSLR